jgi:putative ABC transport system permease protein
VLRAPNAVIVDAGGTSGKLGTPVRAADQWPHDGAHLGVPLRPLRAGDELLVNDHRVQVAARSETVPRFPPRPLMYTSYANAARILPPEMDRLTFILVAAQQGVSPGQLASRIERRTGLRARTTAQFKADTVRWYLINSEDVGDMTAMLMLAMTVGFGVTGVMLYMFSYENQRQYAVLKAMGAPRRMLLRMVFVQAGLCAVLGTGLGIGLCAIVGELVGSVGFPFRMMWFAPVVGVLGVLLISVTAAAISVRPVLQLEPGLVFSGR